MNSVILQKPLNNPISINQEARDAQISLQQQQEEQNINLFSNYLSRLLSPEESQDHMEFEEEQFSLMCDNLFEGSPSYQSSLNMDSDNSDNSSDDCCIEKSFNKVIQGNVKNVTKAIKKQEKSPKQPKFCKRYIRQPTYQYKLCRNVQIILQENLKFEKKQEDNQCTINQKLDLQKSQQKEDIKNDICQQIEADTKNQQSVEKNIQKDCSSPSLINAKQNLKKVNKKYKKKKWSPTKYDQQQLLNEIQGSIVEFDHDSYDFKSKIHSFITFSLNYEEMHVYTKFQERYVRKIFKIRDIYYDVSYDYSNFRINMGDKSYEYRNIKQQENIKKIVEGINVIQQKQQFKLLRDYYNKNVKTINIQEDI